MKNIARCAFGAPASIALRRTRGDSLTMMSLRQRARSRSGMNRDELLRTGVTSLQTHRSVLSPEQLSKPMCRLGERRLEIGRLVRSPPREWFLLAWLDLKDDTSRPLQPENRVEMVFVLARLGERE